MKVVIPVDNDKKTVFKKVGRAPFFNIYENNVLISSLVNNHAKEHEDNEHSHHHEHSHEKDVKILLGCDVILVQAIGEHMSEAIESIGLKIIKLRKDDGTIASEVLEKFVNHKLVNQLKNKPKRFVFPTNEDMGYLSKRGAHFGKAKFYTVITIDNKSIIDVEVVPNQGHNEGACGSAVSNIMSLNPDGLVVSGIGASPAKGFDNAGLKVYFDPESAVVKDSVDKLVLGELKVVLGGTCSTH
jgi:predicted Fe-Mo cluster-binding NifX family protein